MHPEILAVDKNLEGNDGTCRFVHLSHKDCCKSQDLDIYESEIGKEYIIWLKVGTCRIKNKDWYLGNLKSCWSRQPHFII